MADVYFVGKTSAWTTYLQQGLALQGHRFVAQPEAAEVCLLSPLPQSEFPLEGTALQLPELDVLASQPDTFRLVIFLSSAAIYGEGDFACGDCGVILQAQRTPQQLAARRWEVLCPMCGEMLMPLPIQEDALAHPMTPYGRYIQNCEMGLQALSPQVAYPIIRVRLFGPYWPDPGFLGEDSTGVIARFCRALLSETALQIDEDGYSMRDFVHGNDVVAALHLIMQHPAPKGGAYNLGSGQCVTIQELAAYLQEFFGKTHVPYVIQEVAQSGKARHRFADITKIWETFGYAPQYPLLEDLAQVCTALQHTTAQA